jgi:tRNA 5-methylaminomethyl-2-thiouridine biosynthesis bifunctional protein
LAAHRAGGGWWFPAGAWASPPALCAANLAKHPVRTRFGVSIAGLEGTEAGWLLRDDAGTAIAEAPVVILANGLGVKRLAQAAHLPLRCFRGQVTYLPEAATPLLDIVVCREGYITPAVNGVRCVGASFHASEEPALRLSDQEGNLQRLERMLPGYGAGLAAAVLDGRVGFRPVSPDKLPLIGPLTCADAPPARTLRELPRWTGLFTAAGYGARGIIWSALAAELLASRLSAEPWPIEAELADALDPGRFILRAQRRPGLPYALAGWGMADEE